MQRFEASCEVAYNGGMKKGGPKNEWDDPITKDSDPELGSYTRKNTGLPENIHNLIRTEPFQKVMKWSVKDPNCLDKCIKAAEKSEQAHLKKKLPQVVKDLLK